MTHYGHSRGVKVAGHSSVKPKFVLMGILSVPVVVPLTETSSERKIQMHDRKMSTFINTHKGICMGFRATYF